MANKNDFSTTFLKVGMKSPNAEKLVNCLIDKNITINGTVLLAMIGSKQMYEILIKKCSPNTKIIIADSKLVTYYFKNKKNITCVTVKENDADDFYNKLKNMPNFDFVVQNPPYGTNFLYLKFLNKGYDLLTDNGIMISIQPAKFITALRQNTKNKIKKQCNFLNNITKVKINNFNDLFNIDMRDNNSIIMVEKNKIKNIEFDLFGEKKNVNSIDDINYFGSYDLIKSIFEKIENLSICKVQKLLSSEKDNRSAYIRVSNKLTYHSDKDFKNDTDTFFDNTHKNSLNEDWQIVYRYIAAFIHKNDNKIISSNDIDNKNSYIRINIKQSYNENRNILNNFIYFVCHSIIGHALCMLLFQDENGHNYRNVFPFIIFDKEMSDEEYYKYFNLSKDEIELIEKCHTRFERKSKTNFLY